jgi:hypothetical protein
MAFLLKNGDQDGRIGPVGGVGTSWRGKDMGRVSRWVNMLQILCAHIYKWKHETYWIYSMNRGRGDKGEWWREWIQLQYTIRTFVNVTVSMVQQ